MTLDALAGQLGVSVESLTALGVTRSGSAWKIPERDSAGNVVGHALRRDDGSKSFVPGGHRGLTMRWPRNPGAGLDASEPLLIVEGLSDCAAAMDLGYDCIGRPSATGGLDYVVEFSIRRHVCIVGENDASGAGRTGAERTAAALFGEAASVKIIYPPEGCKDLRAWFTAPNPVTRAELDSIIGRTDPLTIAPAVEARTAADPAQPQPVLIRMADVKPERLRWLWPGRIPSGKLSLICGDPNGGKTFLTLDMAARVSSGRPWPDRRDEPNPAGDVLLLSAEDDPADTIVPRLMAAGADLRRICMMQGVKRKGSGKTSFFSLAMDVGALERVADSLPNLRMIVIDPVSAYMGGDTDSHKNADVRGVLGPLAELASRRNIAVVVVTHLSKGAGGRAMYRAIGSIAFIAAARAAWAVVRDPNDETRRRRGMLPIKLNIAAEASGIAYTIEPATVNGIDTAAVHWESEPLDATADEWIAAEQSNADDEERGARQDAAEWLRAALADGPMPADDVKRQATQNSISVATLRRAKTDANAESVKLSYFDKTWYWRIKGDERAPRCSPDTQDAHPSGVSALGKSERLVSEGEGDG